MGSLEDGGNNIETRYSRTRVEMYLLKFQMIFRVLYMVLSMSVIMITMEIRTS